MRRVVIAVLVALFLFESMAYAAVEKVVIKKMEIFKVDGEPQVRIELEVNARGGGEIFVQASTNYDGKDYFTEPVALKLEPPQPFFVLRFTKKDFHRVNLLENINDEVPEFPEGKDIVIYVYEYRYTDPSGQLEDVKQDIAKYGYALRGVLAKGTKTIELARK
ncbi:MAG: hypothetical protein ACUVTO_02250 [Candidatus Caldatribacteriaceae bacterium]